MTTIETKRGTITTVQLNHPTHLPVYKKIERYERHPKDAPPLTLLSGGSGARVLAEELSRLTHHSAHILPVFDDGGSSRELRIRLGMPPPGDLRNRLMALSDMSMSGNPEVSRLFRARLPRDANEATLSALLEAFLDDDHPQMKRIEPRYRRIIQTHLLRFFQHKPPGFDLSGGNIGNFVIAGAYLSVGDLESVIFEFSQLAAALGEVIPVCRGAGYHLKAEYVDDSEVVGQSRITGEEQPPIRRLAIVRQDPREAVSVDRGGWQEVTPSINPLAARALRKASVIGYAMGSFYTSLVPLLLVDGMGGEIRRARRPKVLVANLRRDAETPGMCVPDMVLEICRYLRGSDDQPGETRDYINYVLANTHGDSDANGLVPIEADKLRTLGVEPIVLPLESEIPGVHDARLVAAVLMSLC